MSAPIDLPRPTRRRLVVFWVVAVVLLALLLGEVLADRPLYLLVPVTVWGGWGFSGEFTAHSVHTLMVSLTYWAAIVGIAAQLRRPERQIGGAWLYAGTGVVVLGVMLALGAVPAEAVPILTAVLVFAVLAFIAHPSPLKAKFRPAEQPSIRLAGLVAIAAVPLIVFAVNSFGIHAASGPGDEHFEFGHWAFMGIYPILTIVLGAVATSKVPGWRLPGWYAAILVFAHAMVSLVVPSASALGTVWAVLAAAWAVAFVGLIEFEHRSAKGVATRPLPAPQPAV
jgi:hypothetical protein